MSKLTRHPLKKTRSKEQKTCFTFLPVVVYMIWMTKKTKKNPHPTFPHPWSTDMRVWFIIRCRTFIRIISCWNKKYQIPKKKCFVLLCLSDSSYSAVVVSCCESRCKNRKETLSLPRSHKKTSFFPGAKRLIAPTEKKRRKRNANIFCLSPSSRFPVTFAGGENEGGGGRKQVPFLHCSKKCRKRTGIAFFCCTAFYALVFVPSLNYDRRTIFISHKMCSSKKTATDRISRICAPLSL